MPINLSSKTVNKILKAFDLNAKISKVYPQEKGYRSTILPLKLKPGKKLALVFFKQEPEILHRIKRSNQATSYLAELDWPVRVPISNKKNQTILKVSVTGRSRYCCLYNYLPGSTISWESYTQKHLKLLGQVLGYLHHDLNSFTQNDDFFENQEILNLENLLKKMSKYFIDENVVKALNSKLKLNPNQHTFKYFQKLLKELKKIKQQQVLHMDFVRSNILFRQRKNNQLPTNHLKNAKLVFGPAKKNQPTLLTVSGILDFEKTSQAPKIVDLSRTLAFLLIDCKYKTENQVRKYFLYSGYQKRGLQHINHPKLINPLVNFFLFYDFYKFLKHNPYDSLTQNEHFIRTKDYLIRRKLLVQTDLEVAGTLDIPPV